MITELVKMFRVEHLRVRNECWQEGNTLQKS